jgi:hypothetical protein
MDFCDVRVCQAGAFPGLGGAESATQPSRAAGHKVISQFRGGNRMVFLTHQNPLARPSDHRSPPSCLRSALQLGVLSRRTFAKARRWCCRCMPHAASVRCRSLAPHITMLGEECAEKVACSTLPARTRLHSYREQCIFPQLLAAPTACVAIGIRSHTFDFVNCRHSVSRNAS